MGFLRNYLDMTRKALRGELEPDLSGLTPEQRARYEADMARADAEMAAARERNLQWQREVSAGSVLHGPALPDYEAFNAVLDQPDAGAMLKHSLRLSRQQLAEAASETAAGFRRTVVEPAAQAAELAARTQARVPYRAPSPPDVVVTRVATRGRTQLEELAAHLRASGLAGRPDLVHGVYRVPDRISPNLTPHSEKERLVEWAVVHHPAALHPAAEPIESAAFSRHGRLIARRAGEPGVIDEEVASLYCLLAGVPPEWTFGFARVPEFRHRGGGEHQASTWLPDVAGVTVLHRPTPHAGAARSRFTDAAPLSDPLPAVHHEILDWDAIRERVQPDRRSPAAAPSPLPHLPATPEELLLAYLEVVGVQPGDSYGAQVTISQPRSISGAGSLLDPLGPEQPCADGTPRRRLHAAEHVVLSYRDRPGYAEGRARWAAYQHEVLFARLDHLSAVRSPLGQEKPGKLDRLTDAVNVLADPILALDEWLLEREREPSPSPYCWPPVA